MNLPALPALVTPALAMPALNGLTNLAALSIASAAVVALVISVALRLALVALDRVASALHPRARARLWLAAAALPALGGMWTVALALSAGPLGGDHCLAHGAHHPHLCTAHMPAAPGPIVYGIALAAVLMAGARLAALWRAARASQAATTTLGTSLHAARDTGHDVHVFAASVPSAFVLGLRRPAVYASDALLANALLAGPVLAHERAHARHHDVLWRALLPLLAVGHVPGMRSLLRARLALAQEMAADAAAARSHGALETAEALLALARAARGRTDAPHDAFAHAAFVGGPAGMAAFETRVRALIGADAPADRPVFARAALALVPAALVALATSPHHVHHLLESVLGLIA